MEEQSQFESEFRELILQEEINEPLVFRKLHKDKWDPCTWSLEEWGELFKDEKLTVRYGKKKWDGLQPQWDSDCGKTDLKWKEIIDWNDGIVKLPEGSTSEDCWLYYDYRYLPDIFDSGKGDRDRDFLKVISFNENLKKKFCWSKLGFPERNSDHSTLWIGTAGSYTPCHFDTYSCNIVCQVYGRKRWTLFPPVDTKHLLPTRIPYEESSVYSRINFGSKKRLTSHAQELKICKPFQVVLEAGDCLFLPQKWWHFVQSEDFSISVNTWIELPGDHSARLEEAILRTFTSTVVNMTFPDAAKTILNPNELDVADMSEMDLNDMLQDASSAYLENQRIKMLNNEDTGAVEVNCTSGSNSPPKKIRKCNPSFVDFISRHESLIERIPSINYQSLIDGTEEYTNEDSETISSRSPSYLEHLINAVGHPSILKQISEQFLKNLTQYPPK